MLSPFSAPCFSVRIVYNYGLWLSHLLSFLLLSPPPPPPHSPHHDKTAVMATSLPSLLVFFYVLQVKASQRVGAVTSNDRRKALFSLLVLVP
jgi:hypothetical protein